MTMELDTGEEDVRGSSKNGSDGGDVGKVMTDSTSNPGPAVSPSSAAVTVSSAAAAATPPPTTTTTTTKTRTVDDKRMPLFFQDSSDDEEEAADRATGAVSESAGGRGGSASSGGGGAVAAGGKRKRTPPPPPARRTPQKAYSPPSSSAPAPLQASRPTIAASHVEDAARGLQRSVVSNGGAGGDDDSDDSDIVILSPPRPKVKAPGGGGAVAAAAGVAGSSRIDAKVGAIEPRSGPSSNRSSSRQSSPAVAAAPRSTQANGIRAGNTSAAQASSSASQRPGGPAGAGAWPTGPDAGFIGSYYCTGWSLAKGRGYCTVGSAIVIEREVSPAERAREKKAKQKAEQEQAAAKMAKEKGKVSTTRFGRSSGAMMAQQKLGFGPAAAKANGKKGSMTNGASGGDGSSVRKAGAAAAAQSPTIVRFNNARGFEVGRLPTSDGAFLAPLLEAGLVELSGEVIDCPAELGMGVDILLRIDASLTRRAFEPGSFAATNQAGSGPAGAFWQEVETDAERAMRVRKVALGKLFDRLSLRPTRSSALTEANRRAIKAEEEAQKAAAAASRGKARAAAREGANGGGSGGRIDEVTLDLLHGTQNATTTTSKPASSVAKSTRRRNGGSGGSGEDDDDDDDAESGDEAEVLDEKQLDELETIYQRAQRNDDRLAEMDPPPTFTYTLRPYQKQALGWMAGLERGDASVRDQSAMHPLWEQYTFKAKTDSAAPIEVDDDDDGAEQGVFYFNPYDGELSLEFPRAGTRARGGILADAMGMGKTCMLASLIHTHREGDSIKTSDEDDGSAADEDDSEPAAKRAKFRQITLSSQWRPVASRTSSGASSSQDKPPHATLVVCPVSLAKQWQEELDRMSVKGSLRSSLWYGTDRGDLDVLLNAPDGDVRTDVIITSYGTLVSEHGRWLKNKDKSSYDGGSLFDVQWLRIVLDEAHTIKNRSSRGAKACSDLQAQRRWALTGTPIVNRLEDLYSLLHFLQLEPWGTYSFFRTFVTQPFLAQDPKALDVVQFILEQCLLRREKTMRDRDGKPIVDLPPRNVQLLPLDFSISERKIYDAIYDRSKRKFLQLDEQGKAKSSFTSILAMLMKLRQAVDHPLLVMKKASTDADVDDELLQGTRDDEDVQKLIARFLSAKDDASDDTTPPPDLSQVSGGPVSQCVFCANEVDGEVVLSCFHTGCRECAISAIDDAEDLGKKAYCPACGDRKTLITAKSLREVHRAKGRLGLDQGALRKVDFQTSTKMRALVEGLSALEVQDPRYKALVFSQFTSMLDLIEPVLTDNGIDWLRFDGSMSQKERASVVEEFGKPTKRPRVLLISLKAGGVGLNLTMANHVYMMDCWWNEAIENQAIDRVHRLGQTKPVFVTRFIIKKTIERRILKIQRRKTALVNASLSGKASSDGSSLEDLRAIFGLDGEDSEEED